MDTLSFWASICSIASLILTLIVGVGVYRINSSISTSANDNRKSTLRVKGNNNTTISGDNRVSGRDNV